MIFGPGYRLVVRSGGHWRQSLIEAVAPGDGERILEVSAEDCSACAAFAARTPKARFAVAQLSTGRVKQQKGSGANLEYLECQEGRLVCKGALFDKVICSLALHPLPPEEKLAALRELRRVLRHGGMLHLADFDKPSRPFEAGALRGTGLYFGANTAQPHLDGTWLKIVEQAGFTSVRRVNTFPEMIGRVALVRARRS